MNLRSLLLLPFCAVPAWFAGWHMGARGDARLEPAQEKAVPINGAAGVVERDGSWESLSVLAPTAENRWRALELFGQWVAADPHAAAARLAALPEQGCRLWPGRGAVEAFFKAWASSDAEAAWQAVHAEAFKSVRDTVAALRAEWHPAEIAADESLGKKVRQLAKLKLAAANPMEAVRLGLFDSSLMGAALLGSGDPVARWKEIKDLPQGNVDLNRAIMRLAVNSREAAVTIVQDIIADGKSPDSDSRQLCQCLVRTAANPAELKASPLPKIGNLSEWANAIRTWDEGVLRSALEQPLRQGDKIVNEQEQDLGIISRAAAELLSRDPLALLPQLQRWSADGTLGGMVFPPAVAPNVSPEYAAKVRALIEATPPQGQEVLAVATLPVLEEFEPEFLIERIGQWTSGPEGATALVSSQGVLGRWLERDAAAASAWLEAHPAALSESGMESLAKKWVGQDPESASAWINTLADGARKDAAIRGLVQTLTPHDPASASTWAVRLSDAGQRARVQEEILAQWRVWEPEAKAAR